MSSMLWFDVGSHSSVCACSEWNQCLFAYVIDTNCVISFTETPDSEEPLTTFRNKTDTRQQCLVTGKLNHLWFSSFHQRPIITCVSDGINGGTGYTAPKLQLILWQISVAPTSWCQRGSIPQIFEPQGSCNISLINYWRTWQVHNVNTHKLAMLQQQRKTTTSFNSCLNANETAVPC